MKQIIPILVILLFIISAVSPMVIGFKSDAKPDVDSEMETLLDNLAYYCYDASGFDSIKYEYMKEQLINDYSDNDIEIVEDVVQPVEPVSTESSGPMDSAWPMKCHDLHHTGRSQYSTADNPGYEKWRFRSEWDGTVESSAVIDKNGTIYFGTMGTDCTLYALYPNGTKKWKYPMGTISSTPAIAEDGMIYIGEWDFFLHAVYPNGTRKWKFDARDMISSSPAIAEDGTIYFGCFNKIIFAVNSNGTEKWRYYTGHIISSDPAIGDDGTIYIGSGDGYLYALYPNGTLRWRFKTGDVIKGHPSIADDGTIYIPSYDDHLYALYPNGTIRWKVNTGWGSSSSAAIGADGTVYVATNKLYAIYANGTVKWSLDVGDFGFASPAISADGTIYVCTYEGKHLIAVNPDGTEKWRKQICNLRAESSPCIGEDGTIYVGSSWRDEVTHRAYGFLHAFGPIESNSPPEKPKISGEVNGKIGEEYRYEISALDPDNNPVSFYIEWGDQTHTGWTIDRAPGEKCYYKHTWSKQGDYTIRCKAKDTLGEESDWGYLEVTMPKNQQASNMWFLRWMERFPNAFPIIRHLLGL